MNQYKPGDPWSVEFTTNDGTGAFTNADSTPSVKIFRNAVDDSANWGLSAVSGLEGGLYTISGTVNGASSVGDRITVVAYATIGGISTKGIVERFRLSNSVPVLPTFPTNFAALSITAGGAIGEVVLVDTLTTYTGNTPQTGDVFAALPANFSLLTIDANGRVYVNPWVI